MRSLASKHKSIPDSPWDLKGEQGWSQTGRGEGTAVSCDECYQALQCLALTGCKNNFTGDRDSGEGGEGAQGNAFYDKASAFAITELPSILNLGLPENHNALQKKETQLLLQDLGRWQDYPLRTSLQQENKKTLTHPRPRISLLFCSLRKVHLDYTEKTVVSLRLTSPNCTELLKEDRRSIVLKKKKKNQL